MKYKELNVGLSGVIPVAAYQNLRPSYNVTVEPEESETPEDCFSRLKKMLHAQFELDVNQAKIDLIEKQYQNIRFREKDGKKYPSVTSITDWDKDWRITDDELCQYGARGNVVHRLIEEYIKTGQWIEPETLPELKEELVILATGSLKLSWKDCSYKKFFEQFGKDFEWILTEKEVFNTEHLYSGRYDAMGRYKGKLSIIDMKTGSSYHHKQLAAYAVCEESIDREGIEQLVICPVGFCDTKTGYKKPVVTEQIQSNFKMFLRDRVKFRQRFGI